MLQQQFDPHQTMHTFSPSINCDMFFRQKLSQFLKNPSDASLRFGAFHVQWSHYLRTRDTAASSLPKLEPPTKASVAACYRETLPHQFYIDQYPWNSCRLASTLVAILCSEQNPSRLEKVLRLNIHLLGAPTLHNMHFTPSQNFRPAFERARDAARSSLDPRSTCLAVTINDVGWKELRETDERSAMEYDSFSHSFAMLVSPAGVSMFQGYGPPRGYPLHEQIRTYPDPMPFESAERLMRDFEQVVAAREWTSEVNAASMRCFRVDLLDRQQGWRGLCPRIRLWVQFVELPDVTEKGIEAMAGWFNRDDEGFEESVGGKMQTHFMGLMPEGPASKMANDLIEAGLPGVLAIAMAFGGSPNVE
ncbi:hypothetical protein BC936DRAFT_144325 [Jimgerdemannia flammicorona]|uniref:Uncharacterized protein n=1 Tax=Jimgerdemannia flammicorona TaxID=994334 RepID=A0A433DCP6_9FUNG|nr:hypothetical protein BC936DRAFT_144325 [Jimgerdemannia flammicorona]